jgi:hypothetical protein
MTAPNCVGLAAFRELHPSIGARRFEQPKMRVGASHVCHDQRFRDQLQHLIDDLALGDTASARDGVTLLVLARPRSLDGKRRFECRSL